MNTNSLAYSIRYQPINSELELEFRYDGVIFNYQQLAFTEEYKNYRWIVRNLILSGYEIEILNTQKGIDIRKIKFKNEDDFLLFKLKFL